VALKLRRANNTREMQSPSPRLPLRSGQGGAAGPARYGPHVEGGEGLRARLERETARAAAAGFGVGAFQTTVGALVPRGKGKRREITLAGAEAGALRAFLAARPNLQVVAHGAHGDYPWTGKPGAAEFIRRELAVCAAAGLVGLVIHLGKAPPEAVVAALPSLEPGGAGKRGGDAPRGRPLLFLETPAVKPANALYETPEKLAALFAEIRRADSGLCRHGLCIDTAHLWSSGVDLETYEAAEGWLGRLERLSAAIPPDRVMIHLNDSGDRRGGGVDRHAPLLQGKMWGAYQGRPQQSGLAAFVDYIERHGLLAVLERPGVALLDDYAALGSLTVTPRRLFEDSSEEQRRPD
jgi:sugar phosphate isomerase/epimerase